MKLLSNLLFTLAALFLSACSSDNKDPGTEFMLSTKSVLLTSIGEVRQIAILDTDGNPIALDIDWQIDDDTIVNVSDSNAITAVKEGVTKITATNGEYQASLAVEVYIAEEVPSYQPGQVYYGRKNYIEYRPGTLPVILSGGHGGSLKPSEIPERTNGVTTKDANTLELTLNISDALFALTGERPHVILSHLHRSRLDPNREVVEAAQNNDFAIQAWNEFHEYIEDASGMVTTGVYIDVHGHGHEKQRLELGYRVYASELNQSDDYLNNNLDILDRNSLAPLLSASPELLSELLRGESSLGSLMVTLGVDSVPSASTPSPGNDAFFSGGFNIKRHTYSGDKQIAAIQIEHHSTVRSNEGVRIAYAESLAIAMQSFFTLHYPTLAF